MRSALSLYVKRPASSSREFLLSARYALRHFETRHAPSDDMTDHMCYFSQALDEKWWEFVRWHQLVENKEWERYPELVVPETDQENESSKEKLEDEKGNAYGQVFWRSFVSGSYIKSSPHQLQRQNELIFSSDGEAAPRVLLDRLGLGHYAANFDEQGYQIAELREMNRSELDQTLNNDLDMKPAHAKVLRDALERFLSDLSGPLELS